MLTVGGSEMLVPRAVARKRIKLDGTGEASTARAHAPPVGDASSVEPSTELGVPRDESAAFPSSGIVNIVPNSRQGTLHPGDDLEPRQGPPFRPRPEVSFSDPDRAWHWRLIKSNATALAAWRLNRAGIRLDDSPDPLHLPLDGRIRPSSPGLYPISGWLPSGHQQTTTTRSTRDARALKIQSDRVCGPRARSRLRARSRVSSSFPFTDMLKGAVPRPPGQSFTGTRAARRARFEVGDI